MKITIGKREVGENEPVFVIAEIGLNHNGEVDLARRMIVEAARLGVDAVKFQKRSIPDLLTRESREKAYPGANSFGASYGAHREALELPDDVWPELRDLAYAHGVEFFASPWEEKSADFLFELGVPAFKIASCDVPNLPLLRHVARFGRPVLLSTGMSTLEEVDAAVAAITTFTPHLSVLHCVSAYPFDNHLANLRMIPVLRDRYPQAVIGYSGHEKSGTVISTAAVAMGARIVERHFTLDRTLRGPDHAASLEGNGLRSLITNIRIFEEALGTGEKAILDEERPIRAKLGKSVVAAQRISAGTIITRAMLTMKSPGTGIAGTHLDAICGRVAKRDIEADTIVPPDALGWPRAT
jgi:sialic acid synthase SpsE